MKTPNVTKLIKDVGVITSKHCPEILTGLGIAGMITTTVLAVKATPKALKLIEDYRENECADHHELTPIETAKVAWKPYIPAAVTGVVSIGCLVGASSVNARRNAALATAYQLSTTALSDYKEKVVETIGEAKEKEIRDKVVEDKIKKVPENNSSTIVITGKDDEIPFYDIAFGQLFYSTLERVDAAINKINYDMLSNQYASLNDFYDELGIDRIDIGDSLGWNISRDGMLEVSHDNTQVAKNGKPCFVIEYHVAPTYDYYKI
jgi:hypothetical protein